MKLFLLSDPNSVHTIKWATSLAKNNIDILVYGIGSLRVSDYEDIKNIKVVTFNNKTSKKEGAIFKVSYFKSLSHIKSTISEFKPDILHAHYASSYGLLGALSGYRPFIVSVWGLDIYSFPLKSAIHKQFVKYVLRKADKILSTSNVMAKETSIYTKKKIEVTPFGIDMKVFKPMNGNSVFKEDDIVIGTVKTLEEKYGIEYLIKAFKIVYEKHTNLPLKLLIVGGGSLEQKLKLLVMDLGIEDITMFIGAVPFKEVPNYHNMMDISVFPSIVDSESFGVAIIEASSCSRPVVVSNVGGLPEVVEDGVSGFIVSKKNEIELASKIEKLVLDKELRIKIGQQGRDRVKRLYDWNNNVEQMILIYNDLLSKNN